ncbi:MAG: sulfite exporter TauE/SafE family protein [Tistlia sp.]|uniref:sulfite exporter TauE/SafE family protein n=1 Tax=Tistlia sp. TaxID=3057121 RepID=UPI0034A4FF68
MGESFGLIVAVGFVAQLVDGALGMAYGLTATSLLLGLGYPPVIASATVHLAETATTGVAATAHHLARNVDWALVRRLAVAGCLGGAAGAWLLATGLDEALQPVVSAYLALMGCLLIVRTIRRRRPRAPRRVVPLGLAGGFLDAIGGGGWGPIVSGTLVAGGSDPRRMIGSSAAAEFFVTSVVTATFAGHLGIEAFGQTALALVIGGVPAAPLAALLVRRAPGRLLMLLVGTTIVALGVLGLWRTLGGP